MLAFIVLKTSFDYLDEPHIATITYEYILPISIVNYMMYFPDIQIRLLAFRKIYYLFLQLVPFTI